jgi:hypothetical protein
VFPTLTALNLALGGWLGTLTPVVRTFVLATIAVPIVIYGLMPQLHKLRRRLLTRITKQLDPHRRLGRLQRGSCAAPDTPACDSSASSTPTLLVSRRSNES